MNKVSIYTPAMKLNIIDIYCKEHKMSRSRLFTNATIGFINAQDKVTCSFCHRAAIGKYSITAYDPIEGERKQEKYLCNDHYKKAESEGTEIKEI